MHGEVKWQPAGVKAGCNSKQHSPMRRLTTRTVMQWRRRRLMSREKALGWRAMVPNFRAVSACICYVWCLVPSFELV